MHKYCKPRGQGILLTKIARGRIGWCPSMGIARLHEARGQCPPARPWAMSQSTWLAGFSLRKGEMLYFLAPSWKLEIYIWNVLAMYTV
jgi:hypothetical protein